MQGKKRRRRSEFKILPILLLMGVWNRHSLQSLVQNNDTIGESLIAPNIWGSSGDNNHQAPSPPAQWEEQHVSTGPCTLEPKCEPSKCCLERPYTEAPKELSCPWNRSSILNGYSDTQGITVAVMYYSQPSNLLIQLDHFATYPQHLLKDLNLLIVDDGSPVGLRAQDIVPQHHKQAYRIRIVSILEDVPWNTPQARNLAFYNTDTFLVLMIDLDLLVPQETFSSLLEIETQYIKSWIGGGGKRALENWTMAKHGSTRPPPSWMSTDGGKPVVPMKTFLGTMEQKIDRSGSTLIPPRGSKFGTTKCT